MNTTPELSFTVTGAPLISVRKPDGSFADAALFSMVSGESADVGARLDKKL